MRPSLFAASPLPTIVSTISCVGSQILPETLTKSILSGMEKGI